MATARLAKASLKIPKYIERGPTDILKALASTVKHVPGQPDTMLQDDPYLLPTRPAERRIFILSKLSGYKTAKFILNKHPELFFRDDSEPKVEDFLPMEEFRDDMEFKVDDLKWCIENNDPVNGIIAYKWLTNNKTQIDKEVLVQFFELLCYTNEERLLDHLDYERSRLVADSDEQLVKMTWKPSGFASKIFNEIKEADIDPARVYSAMIAGLCKYNEHVTGKQVFDDFRAVHPDKGLYTSAYDGLLKSVNRLCSSSTTAQEAVEDIVKHMETHLVEPDLRVFNSILQTSREYRIEENTCHQAFKLVNDMRALKIEPSLNTFGSLIAFIGRYKSGQVYGDLIDNILNYIESSVDLHLIRDERDMQFLGSSMNVIANHLNSPRLAHKLHKLYMKNPNLFSNLRYKIRYLNSYFKLVVTTESLENIIDFYQTYVPMHFQPSPDSYEALAEALDLYQANEEIIKKIGNDLIQFRLAKHIKNDTIFRKDPDYVNNLEKLK